LSPDEQLQHFTRSVEEKGTPESLLFRHSLPDFRILPMTKNGYESTLFVTGQAVREPSVYKEQGLMRSSEPGTNNAIERRERVVNFQLKDTEMKPARLITLAALVFLLSGCAGMSRTEQNVLGGGAIGAGLGAAIGAAAFGNPAAGAAIGGAAGLLGGAVVDSAERNREYGPPPPPPGNPYYAPPRHYYGPPPY
jgi:osmotically inducible lipoprotein OsmB